IYHRALGTNHNNGLDAEGLLAEVYEQQGRVEEATKLNASLYPRWSGHFPSYPIARNKCRIIAQFFVKHRRYEEAKAAYKFLREFWAANPSENAQQLDRFIEATAATRGWPAAAALCQKHFDSFPDSLWMWLNKAWIFRYVGDAERYQELVKRVLRLPNLISTNDQHLPIEIAALGSFSFTPEQTKQLDSTMAALETALPGRATNQQVWGYRAIGHLQLQLGRLDKCLEALGKSSLHQTSPDPYNLFIKSICLHRLGRDDEARAVFDQAEAIMKPQLDMPLRQAE